MPKASQGRAKTGSKIARYRVLLELFKILQIAEETTHLQGFSF
jgi:hypothetical protein